MMKILSLYITDADKITEDDYALAMYQLGRSREVLAEDEELLTTADLWASYWITMVKDVDTAVEGEKSVDKAIQKARADYQKHKEMNRNNEK